jgi:putative colanic acid biosynthesis acetyltransferase WcaF
MRYLNSFSNNYARGRPKVVQAIWFAISFLVFRKFWFDSKSRVRLLRVFGARLGNNVYIRDGVKIMWPWKLTVGDDCWIGEDVWIINLETVIIGSNVCLSQAAMLCTGSHDHRRSDFAYANAPIEIADGAWIAARATVLAGVTVGKCSVVAAGEVARKDVPTLHMLIGGELKAIPEPI